MLATLAWRWTPVLAQMIAIFAASSIHDVPDLPAGLSDHTGHLIGYGMLGAFAIRAFAGASWAGVTRGAGVRAVALSAAYGVTDEVHQIFVANRVPDAGDWVADVVGAALAVVVALALANVIRQRRQRRAGSRSV